jgi:NADPH-dependent 2,4-dienoyl-CoA reductase/sulfur reductase-like enzyme
MPAHQELSRRELLQAAGAAGLGSLLTAQTPAQVGSPAGTSPAEAAVLGTITEPARQIPVVADCDVCVVGGSATGVFAAVAAARLGAKVAIIESNGFFGGVATASLVNLCLTQQGAAVL